MNKIVNDFAELIAKETGVEVTPHLRAVIENFIKRRLLDWYTKKDILKVLKEKRMPSTWANFKSYEDFGLLPTTENATLHFHRQDAPIRSGDKRGTVISRKSMPIYTQENIDAIIIVVEKIEEERINRRRNK